MAVAELELGSVAGVKSASPEDALPPTDVEIAADEGTPPASSDDFHVADGEHAASDSVMSAAIGQMNRFFRISSTQPIAMVSPPKMIQMMLPTGRIRSGDRCCRTRSDSMSA